MKNPVVEELKRLRKRHGRSQLEVEICMTLPVNTLRHIEKGRRQLPAWGTGLPDWVNRFLNCVEATPQECDVARQLVARQVIEELKEFLGDGGVGGEGRAS